MKLIKTGAVLVCLLVSTMGFAQSKTETIKVSGNCGSCEKHIEKAAIKAGATSARWDMDTKVLTVSYNASKTNREAIQKSIAAAGYDTEQFTGDEKAYRKLDACCQYDRKAQTPPNK